jgi:hypothetical protein
MQFTSRVRNMLIKIGQDRWQDKSTQAPTSNNRKDYAVSALAY